MAWTATLKGYQQGVDSWSVTVVYDNGAGTVVTNTYPTKALNDTILQNIAIAEVAGFSATADTTKLTITPGSQIPLTVTPPTPTPAQVAQAQFLSDYTQWIQFQHAITLGTVQPSDTRVTNLTAKIKGEWLDSYLSFI